MCCLVGLRLLLLLCLTALFHAADQPPGGGPDGRARPGITGDRPADGAHGRPTGSPLEDTPLRGRRRWRAGLGSGRIEAGLLNSPKMTVIAIARLLLGTLPLFWVDAESGSQGRSCAQSGGDHQRKYQGYRHNRSLWSVFLMRMSPSSPRGYRACFS